MAVAAATDCLRGIDRSTVGGVLFASTSYPYKEKQGASVIAKALDLRRDVATADFGGSLRAGTTALRAALDAVKAGTRRQRPGDRQRLPAWRRRARRSSATSATVRRRCWSASQTVAAEVEAQHTIADEIIDVWRTRRRPVRALRGKTASSSSTATATTLVEAVKGLFAKTGADGEGLHQGGALRARRAQPRGRGARRSASIPRRRCRTRSSAASATPAPPSRRCCWWRRWRTPSPATRCCWRATATAPTPSRCASPTPSSGSATGAASAGTSSAAAELGDYDKYLALPPPRGERVRSPRRRRRVGDHPLPRPQRGHQLARPALPQVRPGAVPLPARLLHLLRARRVRRGAPLGPHRQGALAHLRLLRRQPRSAADRHHDRGRGRRAPLPADDRRQRRRK